MMSDEPILADALAALEARRQKGLAYYDKSAHPEFLEAMANEESGIREHWRRAGMLAQNKTEIRLSHWQIACGMKP
jgi:hypothetical protein